MDLHAGQIQGFFDIPLDNIFAMPIMLEHMRKVLPEKDLVIVSPDAGGMERARAYAKRLNATVAMIDKRRIRANVAQAMNVVGDVEGMTALVIDDMIDTAGTLTEASHAVMKNGAKEVYAAGIHGLFSGPAIERIMASPIQKVFTTDSVLLNEAAKNCPKIHQLSSAPLIAEAISRIHNYDSVSNLFV
jgi:ribose-phosphate pyrophosphokinase